MWANVSSLIFVSICSPEADLRVLVVSTQVTQTDMSRVTNKGLTFDLWQSDKRMSEVKGKVGVIVWFSQCSALRPLISNTFHLPWISDCYVLILHLWNLMINWSVGENYTPGSPPHHLTFPHTAPGQPPQGVKAGRGWCKAEVEKKETTASEVSQMEERDGDGWSNRGKGEERVGQKSARVDIEERQKIIKTLNSLTVLLFISLSIHPLV